MLSRHSSTSYSGTLAVTVRLWLLSDAHCLFLYFGQLQCAYVEVGPSRIAPLMPLLRWAALMSTGTFKLLAILVLFIQLSSTCFLCAGGCRQGQSIQPGLWRGFAAHCHFHCFVLLQCASGEHDPSFIVPTKLPRKWAILLALGTFSCPLTVVQRTCSLVLGVVGKGSTSIPG